ncbi:MAG: ABC transporter substrate-binding protein [Phycisphaerae bacterium]|nr:ABC transporter substrate-binding protein [Phycisphaerae bacterium]
MSYRVISIVSGMLWASGTAVSAAPYHEAPMLAERVGEGRLPTVRERIPERPLVIRPVRAIGKYGGSWRRLAISPADVGLSSRLGYESLAVWDRTGRKVTPGVAEGWEIKDGGRTYVFHLRKGMRWSDGHPFTSEDVLFYYEDVFLNQELTPVFPSWLMIDKRPCVMVAPDAETIEFRFAEPYGLFLEMMAYRGSWLLTPKHYLRQYHAHYVEPESLRQQLDERGLDHWFQLYWLRSNVDLNPELPTVRAFQIKVPPHETRAIAERNPYYWKVDPAGNQLPYIDRIVYAMVQNTEIANFKAMTGDVDYQLRYMDPANFSLFMENRAQGGYRVQTDVSPTSIVLYVNPHSKDEVLRPILADRRFRIALSLAIDREELIDLLYCGMAVASNGVASPLDPFHEAGFGEKHLAYDPEEASRLLDEMGLARGRGGVRRLPNGKPFRQIMHYFPAETGVGADLWQLVADYFREVGLDFIVKIDARALCTLQAMNGNTDFLAYATAGMHWSVHPDWYVPWSSSSYFAPLYGRYQASGGKDRSGVRPPPEYQRLIDWYLEMLGVANDEGRRLELGRNILKQWSEECYTVGIVRQKVVTIISNRFKNVPGEIIDDYRVMSPGYIGIEQFYLDEE